MTRDEAEIVAKLLVGGGIALRSALGQPVESVIAETLGGAFAGPVLLPPLDRQRRSATSRQRIAELAADATNWVANQSQAGLRNEASLALRNGRSLGAFLLRISAGAVPVASAALLLRSGTRSSDILFLTSNIPASASTFPAIPNGKNHAPRSTRPVRHRARYRIAGVRRRPDTIPE